MKLGPTCPECQTRVPFLKTQFGYGRRFACAGCGETLVVPRSQAFALGLCMAAIFVLGRDHFPAEWGGQFGLLAVMAVIGLPVSWALAQVHRA